MGRFYIPEVNEIDGPWLLSHDSLESLDNLFHEIDEKLSSALGKSISDTAKQQMEDDNQHMDLQKRVIKLQRKYSNKSKSAVITFSDGSTFQAKDVKEILHHVNANSTQSPKELYLRSMHGNHENEFLLYITSEPGKEDADFEYQIRCLDYDIQLEIKTIIDKWVRENKPSKVLQVWSNSVVSFVWVICIMAIIISYANLSYTVSKADNYKAELKKEAQKMVETRSDSLKVDSTLLLLLKLQSDYVPEEVKSEVTVSYNKSEKKILIVSLIIFVISIICPNTVIGIGKKYNKYKFYKFWWRYVICGGIALLFTTLLADSFLNFIKW